MPTAIINHRSLALITLATLLLSGATAAGTLEAYRTYSDAKAAYEQGLCDQALNLVNLAIEEEPKSQRLKVGIQRRYYLPYVLRGWIFVCLGDNGQALQDCEKELADGAAADHKRNLREVERCINEAKKQVDNDLPTVKIDEIRIVEFRYGADGSESVDVNVSGIARDDDSGIKSLTIDDHAVDLKPNTHKFNSVVTIDPKQATLTVKAVDGADKESRDERPLNIPPRDLGEAAKGIHAVVVGVDFYGDYAGTVEECKALHKDACSSDTELDCFNLQTLNYAAKDADDFAQFLWWRGVPRENVALLTTRAGSDDATREGIIAALEAKQEQLGDKLIFFFSGHGMLSEAGTNLVLPSNAQSWACRGTDALEHAAISVAQLRDYLWNSLYFSERYIILDACRTPTTGSNTKGDDPQETLTDGFTKGGDGRFALAERSERGMKPITFYSTLDKKVSVEWRERENGYFTWHLLQELRKDPSLFDLEREVQRRVSEKTAGLCAPGETAQSCRYTQKPHMAVPEELDKDYVRQGELYILRSSTVDQRPAE